MKSFSLPAFAKVNLGLEVVARRSDGYHELRTVYQTISLRDTLRFETPAPSFSLVCSPRGAVPAGENLVQRAALAFAHAARIEPRVRVTLHKRIPVQAGLGGGSSDAAATLLALNALFGRPLDHERLTGLAAALGSDVPFFLTGGTALGLGRGEIVRPLRDLERFRVVIALPDFGIPTWQAFGRVDATLTRRRGQISIYRFSRQWVRGTSGIKTAPNDLERAVAPRHPKLASLLAVLRSSGATVAAMAGSGSAVYGLFAGEGRADRALRRLTGSSQVARAWLVRTVGAAEYSSRVLELGRGHTSE